ncbi:hypothetical protein OGAPHI_006826 [Ogataea philodendri]|uniref:DUF1868 domain-containing protein n=1 Tax=Ogataea philodendri TaxID=1378263 RepID=A0A9P8NXT7_9ASCO|nr:uncharacterized protein OGAPHI_006826 [Ogataea philodendri]KAH3661419.1 hypothetical protein OGAPHI_006826 [Ogataea philodendri]
MGRKFKADGTVNKFRGNTVLCHLPQQGPGRDLFKRLLDFYKEFPILLFKNKITMLPSSNLHMTMFDCIHEFKRESEGWPKDLPRDPPIEQCNEWMVKTLTETSFDIDLPIRLQVDSSYVEQTSHGGMDTWKVALLPLNSEEEQKIKQLRVGIATALGIPLPTLASYKFHMTIAYINEEFTPEESAQLKALVDKFHQEARVVELGAPEVCCFEDMFYMERFGFLGKRQ